jgi:hypothetical protein
VAHFVLVEVGFQLGMDLGRGVGPPGDLPNVGVVGAEQGVEGGFDFFAGVEIAAG